jgi:hypothetical protein
MKEMKIMAISNNENIENNEKPANNRNNEYRK